MDLFKLFTHNLHILTLTGECVLVYSAFPCTLVQSIHVHAHSRTSLLDFTSLHYNKMWLVGINKLTARTSGGGRVFIIRDRK